MKRFTFATIVALFVAAPVAGYSEIEKGDTPELQVETLDGETRSLEEWRGKVVLVDFWATWCDPCRDSLPFYERLADEYDDRFRVLAVSVDERKSAVASFVDRHDFSFDVAFDDGHAIADRFEPPTMPTCYLIGPDGEVEFVHAGFEEGDDAALAERVESLVAETDGDSGE